MNYLIPDNKFKCKVTGREYSVGLYYLVTAIMLCSLFHVKIFETGMHVQLLILRMDLENTKATLRRRR